MNFLEGQIIGEHKVRRLKKNFYLVGAHQYAIHASIEALKPKFIIGAEFTGLQSIDMGHFDAHADMNALNSDQFSVKEIAKIISEVGKLRTGQGADISFIKKMASRVYRSQEVTFMVKAGLVDMVHFIANTAYDYRDCRARGVLPTTIKTFTGKDVFVEFQTLASLTNSRGINFWDIDTDIIPFVDETTNRRGPITTAKCDHLVNILKSAGHNNQNQLTIVSHQNSAFGGNGVGFVDRFVNSLKE